VKFDRLRIAGFKTFVDPAELVIEPGLTGVVGPNGCGKSNLVEALRWVMGETSHKSMRASGMDDVIFAGSGQRPQRNHAEVMLRIDNADHTAPAQFNTSETLEISRRIEREAGSTYRINGREVRARDVQLLFADAASGARSPSMVRQGQISEIIAAKPQARRRILEDAAGVAGLHARRHDAELKLRSAEDNLTRVVDVLTHIDGQIEALKRQARQAERYRVIAADLRRAEATQQAIHWAAALQALTDTSRQVDLDTRAVAAAMTAQGAAERERAVAQHAIEPLRTEEMRTSEALQRLLLARETLDGEERRTRGRIEELDRRLAELAKDSARTTALIADADAALERLAREADDLSREAKDQPGADTARARLADADAAVARAEQTVQDIQVKLAEATAMRSSAEQTLSTAQQRLSRLSAQGADQERQHQRLAADRHALPDTATRQAAVAEAQARFEAAEATAVACERQLREDREAEARLRPALQDAERATQQLETEARTLAKLLSGTGGPWPRVLDALTVQKGFEVALGAALGDDIDASTDPRAPARWGEAGDDSADPALPEGTAPLFLRVKAPVALHRRLRQIGVVERADGPRLASQLLPGQRLVSREGDLWRWDGFSAAAEAPSAAARRLAEQNRLGEVEAAAQEAATRRDAARTTLEAASLKARASAVKDAEARDGARMARRAFDAARDAAASAERAHSELQAREQALQTAKDRLIADQTEANAALADAEAALAASGDAGTLPQQAAEARAKAAEARSLAAEARAILQGLIREEEARARRLAAIAEDRVAWDSRKAAATAQGAEVANRTVEVRAERARLEGVPGDLMARRRTLGTEIEAAEVARKFAADARAEGETALATFDRAARDAMAALSATREARARSEAQLDAANARREALAADIRDAFEVEPDDLRAAAGLGADASLPSATSNDVRIAELRRERERIGAVNLRAEDELREVETSKSDLTREHQELSEAIRRLRRGIESLNAEGRNRLVAAFEMVNGHFGRLFSRLFGGGTAELQLIESEDPLEAGLEILAHPPGKKPQVLTLLSGGEQALTATALIFAVFLTNPSPVCVLDEVDAPLDDANVDRLCDLLTDMARETATRFVVITHNPISMARMDRLFGVTMAERGVSQLVSVDLSAAERLAEAG